MNETKSRLKTKKKKKKNETQDLTFCFKLNDDSYLHVFACVCV